MQLNQLSIATLTWARDEDEEKVLRQSMEQMAALQVPVFISDGGSSAEFLQFLKSFPHFHILPPAGNGVWPQAKNSLMAAFQNTSPFIFYTEPDKKDFFQHGVRAMIESIKDNANLGIVMASRSVKSFATFPPFQQMTETTINNCVAEVIGPKVDYTYGPFLMNKKLVPYLQQIEKDTSWGWRPYAFVVAKKLGLEVAFFEGDFDCPPAQQKDTEKDRLYRIQQLSQNIEGLLAATKIRI